VRSDPRGRELKKSRRNRGALHGDSCGGEADVFANYALPLHLYCDSLLLPFPAFNLLPTVLTDRYDGFRQVGLLVPGIDGEVKDRSARIAQTVSYIGAQQPAVRADIDPEPFLGCEQSLLLGCATSCDHPFG
jgi:hypothetical protein